MCHTPQNSPRLPAAVLGIGAVVGTLMPAASDVDKDDCDSVVMSCRIHSCCSGIKPFSEADDRAIASSYFAASTSGETMEGDTEKIVPKCVATAASVDSYRLRVRMCTLF